MKNSVNAPANAAAASAVSQQVQQAAQQMDLSPITRNSVIAPDTISPAEVGQQLLRLRRIGKRIFNVANCLISLDGLAPNFPLGERSMPALEEAFCASLGNRESVLVVADTREDAVLAKHRAVVGAPYVRFYAAHPLYSEEQVLIGCIHLLAYAAHAFTDEDRQLLVDFATTVERELRFNAMNASQIDLIKKNRSLRRDSLVDPVIGTWNRAAITRMLATETERCYNEEKPLSVVLVDLDSHKQICDQYGLPAADHVLLKFASRLRSCIRPSDALGRYEGETFLIVLPGASQTTVKVVAERIRKVVVNEPESVGQEHVKLGVSIGTVSTDLFPSAAIDDLISEADKAQRQAKKAGHNLVRHAAPA
jgi:diguanylate cyclase (GGDEF)-like protein